MIPHIIFWEITQKCNLSCPYCRRDNFTTELSLKESFHIIVSISQDYKPLIIFSGGEPLLYPYFFEVASYARKKGLTIALATNATLIDEDLAEKIKSVGFWRVSVSLDAAMQDIHDSLRGRGSFLKTLKGIQHLKSKNINLQINTTIFRKNFKQVHLIYRLCLELKVKALHIFAFVPVGCGITVPKEERLSQDEYESFLDEMAHLSLESKIEIKITCAPHYNRIISKIKSDFTSLVTKGCLAASAVCFISSKGDVYPCGYLKLSAGNIFTPLENSKSLGRKKSLTGFKEIWEDSYLFKTLRNPDYLKGKCSVCEYMDICGGCRARAWAVTGDYLEEEPECLYQPLNVRS